MGPQTQQRFSVETTFIRKGTFEVYAENEEQAKQIVETKCGVEPSKIYTSLPLDDVGWEFELADMIVGEAKQLEE